MSEGTASNTPQSTRSYAPIPMPFWVRWREFRSSVLPVFVFLILVMICLWLWSDAAVANGVPGIADGVRSVVSSPRPAVVQRLFVEPYQIVNAGDPIAVVLPIDPRAELGLLRTEMDLARIGLQPSLAEENTLNFERIRVDLLRTKSELAIARVNLARTENQANRDEKLFNDNLLSEDLYDLSTKTRDAFRAEVVEKSNAVAQIEKRLEELQAFSVPQSATNVATAAALERLNGLRLQVATNWFPITLRASISGMVSSISHQPGENTLEGEPIVSIQALNSDRVVGYLRQPYPFEPRVGMEVLITTRERKPRRFTGAVTHIGAQLEIITNSLAFMRVGALVDSGLPIAIALPPDTNVRPGEVLDLSFRSPRRGLSNPIERILPANRSTNAPPQHAAKK
jgi:multidrug resistance efflux pump